MESHGKFQFTTHRRRPAAKRVAAHALAAAIAGAVLGLLIGMMEPSGGLTGALLGALAGSALTVGLALIRQVDDDEARNAKQQPRRDGSNLPYGPPGAPH